jgi:colanic acid/amylovoran biosynthesis protein
MSKEASAYRFVLAGNGPVSNRGCQAILYGTHKILEREFGPCRFVAASFAKDPPGQLPPRVEPLELSFERPRWSRAWWMYQVRRGLGLPPKRDDVLKVLKPGLARSDALFSIGGDNYAIDCGYEIVDRLLAMDACAKAMGMPVIIWGASIGPFKKDPAFEKQVARHLSEVDLIVLREPMSQSYLRSIGVEHNVALAPDPAFAVEPLQPPLTNEMEELLADGFIGLNLSPLLANYATGGDLDRWRTLAAQIMSSLLGAMDCRVCLIPHVTSSTADPRMDDALFLQSVRESLEPQEQARTAVFPGQLSCEQLKWVISRAEIFIGARTHSTLAALSTGVPCISIAYSQKAWGVNEWIFGHQNWVVASQGITGTALAARAVQLRKEKDAVRGFLQKIAPRMQEETFAAAGRVAGILKRGEHGTC